MKCNLINYNKDRLLFENTAIPTPSITDETQGRSRKKNEDFLEGDDSGRGEKDMK